MDIQEASQYLKLCDEQIELAKQYHDYRIRAGTAKRDLDIILASQYLSGFRQEKKNLGYEFAILMLVEKDSNAAGIYRDYVTCESHYRALEKLIDAYQGKISFIQSILKYTLKGEQSGNS